MKKFGCIVMIWMVLVTNISFADSTLTPVFQDLDTLLLSEKTQITQPAPVPSSQNVILGNERLFSEYRHLIEGKRVGIVTNQTGVDSKGVRTVERLLQTPYTTLVAAYSPEHGLDGKASAGKYVSSYQDRNLGIPVYSLYGSTREPSRQMLQGIDVLLFDMQDIGSRTYTYMSTLNYVMKACAKYNIPLVVLDRPNPLGGTIVEGHIAKDKYLTFVGVDNLPLAHGMTCGELANFFNRKIHANITVIPMKGYRRSMIWQDTGLPFVMTSPNIPDVESAFLYMATGMGEGTGLGQANKFHWVGGKKIDANRFAKELNASNLPGVRFEPKQIGNRGGVNVVITDYHTFNPAKTGMYTLAIANRQADISIPRQTGKSIPMFEKLFGSDEMGKMLLKKSTGEEIIQSYQQELNQFKRERKQYLLYQ